MATNVWLGNDSGNEGKWQTAANWSLAHVPINGEDIVFEDSSQSVTADFDQSAVTPNSLTVSQSFTGEIGDADEYLVIGTPTRVDIGEHYGHGTPRGSNRLKLDLRNASATGTITIHNSSVTSTDTNDPPIQLLIAGAGITLNVRKGKAGVAVRADQTSSLGTLNITYVTAREADADVVIGPGVTLTTVNQMGGRCVLQAAATTINLDAGTMRTEGAGAVGTIAAEGGKLIANSRGTITLLEAYGAACDFLQSAEARTVITLRYEDAGSIAFDPGVLTVGTWSPQKATRMSLSAA